MSLPTFDPDKAIHNEARILAHFGFFNETLARRGLRELAFREAALGFRYAASCSYQWATTERYERGTREHEEGVRKLARDMGLHVYLQTDPRGRTVYVDTKPLTSSSYSSQGVCIFYPMED